MVIVSIVSIIAAAAVQTAAANSSRSELRDCLKQAVEQAKFEKLAADAFGGFAAERCGTPAQSLKSALVSFDVKNKISRKQAEEDAQLQIDDFVTMAGEKYSEAAPQP